MENNKMEIPLSLFPLPSLTRKGKRSFLDLFKTLRRFLRKKNEKGKTWKR